MSRANPLAAPYARSRRGGGDTLAIWRWQGKAGRNKALTMMGGQWDQIRSDRTRALGRAERPTRGCPATRTACILSFVVLPLACAAASEVDIAVRNLA
jgi:hypothetical protein